MVTCPVYPVQRPASRAAMVLLPLPEAPTSETKLPCGTVKETSRSTVRFAS